MSAYRHKTLRLAGLLTVLAIALPAAARPVYVWKDGEGKSHYTDLPPPGVESRLVDIGPNTPPTGDAAVPEKSLADQELEFRKRRSERAEREAKAAEDAAQKEKLARQCADARRQITALESGQRVVRYNDKGEREYLNDEQRKEQAEDLRKAIEKRCK